METYDLNNLPDNYDAYYPTPEGVELGAMWVCVKFLLFDELCVASGVPVGDDLAFAAGEVALWASPAWPERETGDVYTVAFDYVDATGASTTDLFVFPPWTWGLSVRWLTYPARGELLVGTLGVAPGGGTDGEKWWEGWGDKTGPQRAKAVTDVLADGGPTVFDRYHNWAKKEN